jgi:hypothetical protein
MFAPSGWISLKDIYDYFVWYFSENDALGSFIFTGDECYELTWYFANEADEIAVCNLMGVSIPASRGLVETRNEYDNENLHVNLHYGTVGSGSVLTIESLPDGITSTDQYADILYGPFRHLPLIFKKSDFEDYLQRLAYDEDADTITETALDMSPRAVSLRILEAWHENKSLVLSDLKQIIAPDMSTRQFRFAWGLAVMDEPALSKPGRRKQQS